HPNVTIPLRCPEFWGCYSPTSYLEPRVDKCNLLRGGCLDSGISSLRSTGGGMYIDGGSGGSGGGGNAAVTASMRAWVDAILRVWFWVRHPDDGGWYVLNYTYHFPF
ncbi:hypothetical protein Tco_0447137, partial [Tanacetum coccineum]